MSKGISVWNGTTLSKVGTLGTITAIPVYCGSTCKCTLSATTPLCLGSNAFNSTAFTTCTGTVTGIKVYCGTTCKCTVDNTTSICLGSNAFNSTAFTTCTGTVSAITLNGCSFTISSGTATLSSFKPSTAGTADDSTCLGGRTYACVCTLIRNSIVAQYHPAIGSCAVAADTYSVAVGYCAVACCGGVVISGGVNCTVLTSTMFAAGVTSIYRPNDIFAKVGLDCTCMCDFTSFFPNTYRGGILALPTNTCIPIAYSRLSTTCMCIVYIDASKSPPVLCGCTTTDALPRGFYGVLTT